METTTIDYIIAVVVVIAFIVAGVVTLSTISAEVDRKRNEDDEHVNKPKHGI